MEIMIKNSLSISIIFLGVCILLGSWFIYQSLGSGTQVSPISEESEEQYRFDFISANEQNVIIFDKKTGNYWRKFIEPNEGPTKWEKQQSPVTTQED